ncbi:MAG: hypothetical protein Q7V63_07370 [Gammaproteobacteria bacterium]|nr:hypothetical protein [Gammaproteobacteria bacterium]
MYSTKQLNFEILTNDLALSTHFARTAHELSKKLPKIEGPLISISLYDRGSWKDNPYIISAEPTEEIDGIFVILDAANVLSYRDLFYQLAPLIKYPLYFIFTAVQKSTEGHCEPLIYPEAEIRQFLRDFSHHGKDMCKASVLIHKNEGLKLESFTNCEEAGDKLDIDSLNIDNIIFQIFDSESYYNKTAALSWDNCPYAMDDFTTMGFGHMFFSAILNAVSHSDAHHSAVSIHKLEAYRRANFCFGSRDTFIYHSKRINGLGDAKAPTPSVKTITLTQETPFISYREMRYKLAHPVQKIVPIKEMLAIPGFASEYPKGIFTPKERNIMPDIGRNAVSLNGKDLSALFLDSLSKEEIIKLFLNKSSYADENENLERDAKFSEFIRVNYPEQDPVLLTADFQYNGDEAAACHRAGILRAQFLNGLSKRDIIKIFLNSSDFSCGNKQRDAKFIEFVETCYPEHDQLLLRAFQDYEQSVKDIGFNSMNPRLSGFEPSVILDYRSHGIDFAIEYLDGHARAVGFTKCSLFAVTHKDMDEDTKKRATIIMPLTGSIAAKVIYQPASHSWAIESFTIEASDEATSKAIMDFLKCRFVFPDKSALLLPAYQPIVCHAILIAIEQLIKDHAKIHGWLEPRLIDGWLCSGLNKDSASVLWDRINKLLNNVLERRLSPRLQLLLLKNKPCLMLGESLSLVSVQLEIAHFSFFMTVSLQTSRSLDLEKYSSTSELKPGEALVMDDIIRLSHLYTNVADIYTLMFYQEQAKKSDSFHYAKIIDNFINRLDELVGGTLVEDRLHYALRSIKKLESSKSLQELVENPHPVGKRMLGLLIEWSKKSVEFFDIVVDICGYYSRLRDAPGIDDWLLDRLALPPSTFRYTTEILWNWPRVLPSSTPEAVSIPADAGASVGEDIRSATPPTLFMSVLAPAAAGAGVGSDEDDWAYT